MYGAVGAAIPMPPGRHSVTSIPQNFWLPNIRQWDKIHFHVQIRLNPSERLKYRFR